VAGVETPAPTEAAGPAAIEVLRGYLAAQSTAFLAQLPRLRQGHPEAAHRIRVACRRARSMLRTFAPLLDEEWAGALAAQLSQFTTAVGPERDVQVVRLRLLAGFDELGDQDAGVLRARSLVDRLLQRESTNARESTLATLAGPGFHALADQIALAPATLPGREAAHRPAAEALLPLVRESYETIERRVRRLPRGDLVHPGRVDADGRLDGRLESRLEGRTPGREAAGQALPKQARKPGDNGRGPRLGDTGRSKGLSAAESEAHQTEADEAGDEIWHRLRISAKRGRYAAEVCVPLAGAAAVRLADQLTRLTEALGHQQDAAMASAVLIRAAQTPRIVAPTAFALGRLLGDQRAQIVRARCAFPELWDEVSQPGYRTWLDQ
jgi:CHAD domain-containing protein